MAERRLRIRGAEVARARRRGAARAGLPRSAAGTIAAHHHPHARALLRAWLLGTTALLPPSAAGTAAAQGIPASARPTGGQVVAGSASIGQSAAQTTISQASQRAAIEWQQFNVGSNHTVQFNQPNAQAWTLNRVTTPDPSVVAGRIQANGGVAIVNQSGVVFAQGSQVNVGSLIASAANVTNQNFMAGRMVFDGPARPGARVENHGTITVADRGLAALVGPRVTNTGTIQARLGRVALTGGAEAYTLDLAGDGLLSIDVTQAVRTAPSGNAALVTNSGVIEAAGGAVAISAHAASGLVEDMVRHTGRTSANTEGGQQGQVAIRASGGGAVRVEGTVEARGNAAGQRGGRIEAQAAGGTVTVARGARLDASGQAGGGAVQVGGRTTRSARVEGAVEARGHGRGARGGQVAAQAAETVTVAAGGSLDVSGAGGGGTALIGTGGVGRNQPMAARTTVEQGAAVRADAVEAGQGGTIAVNSTTATEMRGVLAARGGATDGDGGFVEISGLSGLTIAGRVLLDAPAGRPGTLLIDPERIRVVDSLPASPAPPDANEPLSGSGRVTAQTADGGTLFVLNTDIQVHPGNVSLEALSSITVAAGAPITKTNGNLSLEVNGANPSDPSHGIFINAPVTVGGSALTLVSTSNGTTPAGRVVLGASIEKNGGTGADLSVTGGSIESGAGAGIASDRGLTLTAGTTITLGTGAVSAGRELAMTAGTVLTLGGTVSGVGNGGNPAVALTAGQIVTLGGAAITGGGNGVVALTATGAAAAAGGISLGAGIDAGAGGTVTLAAAADKPIAQTGGTIIADALIARGTGGAGTAAGSIALDGPGNQVATLAEARANGTVAVRSDVATFTVATAAGNGVTLINGIAPVAGSSAGAIAVSGSVAGGAGEASIVADRMDLQAGAAVTGTRVTLRPFSPARPIRLGGSDPGIDALHLSTDLLGRIGTAAAPVATLQIGALGGTPANDSAITLATGAIAFRDAGPGFGNARVNALDLRGASVAQDSGGALNVGAVAAQASNGGIRLFEAGNSFDAVGGAIAAGAGASIRLRSQNPLSVAGAVQGDAGGLVRILSEAGLTVAAGTGSVRGGAATRQGSVLLEGASITLAGPVDAANVALRAADGHVTQSGSGGVTAGSLAASAAGAGRDVLLRNDGTSFGTLANAADVLGTVTIDGVAVQNAATRDYVLASSRPLTVAGDVAAGSGRHIALTAPDLTLSAALRAEPAGGDLGSISLRPFAAGTGVTLGADAGGGFALNGAEIALLRAGTGTLFIGTVAPAVLGGDAAPVRAGRITLAGDVPLRPAAPARAAELGLHGGSVRQTGGVVDVERLSGSAAGAFAVDGSFGAGNRIDRLGTIAGGTGDAAQGVHIRTDRAAAAELGIAGAVTAGANAALRIETPLPLAVLAGGSLAAGSPAASPAEAGTVHLWGSRITLGGTVTAGDGVTLVATGGGLAALPGAPVAGATIVQDSAGAIAARRLSTASADATTLTEGNAVDAYSGLALGDLAFRSTRGLTIGAGPAVPLPGGSLTAGPIAGVTGAGLVRLRAEDVTALPRDLTVLADVTSAPASGPADVRLEATGSVVVGDGSGPVTVFAARGDVLATGDALAAAGSTASVTVRANATLRARDPDSIANESTGADLRGNIALQAPSVSVAGTLDAARAGGGDGGRDVTLAATNGTLAVTGTIAARRDILGSSTGAADQTLAGTPAIRIGSTAGLRAERAITLADTAGGGTPQRDMQIGGDLVAGSALTIQALSGDLELLGTARLGAGMASSPGSALLEASRDILTRSGSVLDVRSDSALAAQVLAGRSIDAGGRVIVSLSGAPDFAAVEGDITAAAGDALLSAESILHRSGGQIAADLARLLAAGSNVNDGDIFGLTLALLDAGAGIVNSGTVRGGRVLVDAAGTTTNTASGRIHGETLALVAGADITTAGIIRSPAGDAAVLAATGNLAQTGGEIEAPSGTAILLARGGSILQSDGARVRAAQLVARASGDVNLQGFDAGTGRGNEIGTLLGRFAPGSEYTLKSGIAGAELRRGSLAGGDFLLRNGAAAPLAVSGTVRAGTAEDAGGIQTETAGRALRIWTDSLTLDPTANAFVPGIALRAPGGQVEIAAHSAGRPVEIGGATGASALVLDSAAVARLDTRAPGGGANGAGILVVGRSDGGAISLVGDVDLRSPTTFADPRARRLVLLSADGVTQADGARLNVEQVAGRAGTGFALDSRGGGGAPLNAVNAVAGAPTTLSNLPGGGGSLTVAGIASVAGDVTLRVGGTAVPGGSDPALGPVAGAVLPPAVDPATGAPAAGVAPFTVAGAITATAGNIALRADDMALNAALGAPAGHVTLQPATSGQPVLLGGVATGAVGAEPSPGRALSLTNAELNQVAAGILRIGGPFESRSAVPGAVIQGQEAITLDPARVPALALRTPVLVEQRGALLNDLPGAGLSVASLSARVDTAERPNPADATPAYVWLGADNAIGTVGADGLVLSLDGRSFGLPASGLANNAITLRGTAGGVLTVGGPVAVAGPAAQAGGGAVAPRITLVADGMAIGAAVSAPAGAIELLPRTAGRTVQLGDGAPLPDALRLDGAALGLLATGGSGVLRIGRSADAAVAGATAYAPIGGGDDTAAGVAGADNTRLAGDIRLTGPVALAGGASQLELYAGVAGGGATPGRIAQDPGATLAVARLAGASRQEALLGEAGNQVGALAPRTVLAAADGGVSFRAGTAAGSAAEARLTLRTGAAPLAVGGEVSAGLAADGTAVRQPGGTLALVADDMAVAAPLRAPAGVVALTVHTAGTGIGLAGGAGGLALSAAELGFVDTGAATGLLRIGSLAGDPVAGVAAVPAAGAIRLGTETLDLTAGVATLELRSPGGIEQAGGPGASLAVANLSASVRTADRAGGDASPAFIWLGADNAIGAIGDPTGLALAPGLALTLDGRSFALPSGGLANNAITLREAPGRALAVTAPITVAGPASQTGGGAARPRITLLADDLALSAAVGAAGTPATPGAIELLPRSPGHAVQLGDGAPLPGGALHLDGAELALLGGGGAGTLRIGRSEDPAVTGAGLPAGAAAGIGEAGGAGPRTAGDIQLTGDVLLRGRFDRLELFAGVEGGASGTILQDGAGRLDVARLAGEARQAATLGNAANAVDALVLPEARAAGLSTTAAFLAGTAGALTAPASLPAQGGFTLATANSLAVQGDVQTRGSSAPLSMTAGGTLTIGGGLSLRAGGSGYGTAAPGGGTHTLRLVAAGDVTLGAGTMLAGTGRDGAQPFGPSLVQSIGGSVLIPAGGRIVLGYGAPGAGGGGGPGVEAAVDIVTAGEVNAFAARAGRDIVVESAGSLTLARDASAGRDIRVESALVADGNATGGLRAAGHVQAGRDVTGPGGLAAGSVAAPGGFGIAEALVASSLDVSNGLSVVGRVAARDIAVGGSVTVAPGAVLEATNGITAGAATVASGGRLTAGSLALTAGGLANDGQVIASAVTAAAGNVVNTGRIEGAAIQAAGPGPAVMDIPSNPPENLVRIATQRWAFNTAGQALSVTAGGDIVNAGSGVISTVAEGALPAAYGNSGFSQFTTAPVLLDSPLTLRAGAGVRNEAGARITATGAIDVQAGTGIETAGLIESAGLAAGVSGDILLRAAGGHLVQSGGSVRTLGGGATLLLASAGGDVVQRDAARLEASSLRIEAGGAIGLGGANRFDALAGAAAGSAGARIRGERFVVTGDVTAAGGITLHADADLGIGRGGLPTRPAVRSSAGDVSLAAATGAVAIGPSTVQAAGTVEIAAPGGGIAIAGADLAAADRMTIQAGGGLSLGGGTTLSADSAHLAGQAIALGSLSASLGTNILMQAPGGIAHTAPFIVVPRTGGQFPAVIYDTRTAPPQDATALLAQIRPDLPGRQPEQQPTQVRAAAGADLPNPFFGPARSTPAGPVALQIQAGRSPVFLLLDGGVATGTVSAGRLVVHGTGGRVDLFGQLAGLAGFAAARAGDVTRPAPPGSLSNYRVNGCVIGSINCVVLPRFQRIPPILRTAVEFVFRPGQFNPIDVTVPNTGEDDYE